MYVSADEGKPNGDHWIVESDKIQRF